MLLPYRIAPDINNMIFPFCFWSPFSAIFNIPETDVEALLFLALGDLRK